MFSEECASDGSKTQRPCDFSHGSCSKCTPLRGEQQATQRKLWLRGMDKRKGHPKESKGRAESL